MNRVIENNSKNCDRLFFELQLFSIKFSKMTNYAANWAKSKQYFTSCKKSIKQNIFCLGIELIWFWIIFWLHNSYIIQLKNSILFVKIESIEKKELQRQNCYQLLFWKCIFFDFLVKIMLFYEYCRNIYFQGTLNFK